MKQAARYELIRIRYQRILSLRLGRLKEVERIDRRTCQLMDKIEQPYEEVKGGKVWVSYFK